jgi:hypothetical protein
MDAGNVDYLNGAPSTSDVGYRDEINGVAGG